MRGCSPALAAFSRERRSAAAYSGAGARIPSPHRAVPAAGGQQEPALWASAETPPPTPRWRNRSAARLRGTRNAIRRLTSCSRSAMYELDARHRQRQSVDLSAAHRWSAPPHKGSPHVMPTYPPLPGHRYLVRLVGHEVAHPTSCFVLPADNSCLVWPSLRSSGLGWEAVMTSVVYSTLYLDIAVFVAAVKVDRLIQVCMRAVYHGPAYFNQLVI